MSRKRAALAITLLLLGSAVAALAAPLPSPRRLHDARRLPDTRGLAAHPAAPQEATGWSVRCGASLEAVTDVIRDHLARPLSVPLPTPHSADIDGIAVLEDDGRFFFKTKDNNTVADINAISRAFYRTHGDDYEWLGIYLSGGLNTWLGSPGALAASFVVRNDTQGLGLELFDLGSHFGSAARLQNILSMNGLHRYRDDPNEEDEYSFTPLDYLAHEMGHRWLSYCFLDSAGVAVPALLGRAYEHWNFFFDNGASIEEGCAWAPAGPDSFRTTAIIEGFGPLDQYLMGLRSKAEMDSFFVVNDPTDYVPSGSYEPQSVPIVGLGCRGQATWWTVDDIEAAEGPRVPDAASAPHDFRMALVLVTARGQDPTAADLQKLGGYRAAFPGYFSTATDARGTVDLTLDSHAGQVSIAHDPLPDTEDESNPRPIAAQVTIAQAGIPLAVDPASVRAFWRPGTSGGFTPVPMSPAASDTFVADLPALPGGGTAQYYLYAASDSSGIDAFDPPAGPTEPHAYVVGPDATPPAIAHVPVGQQGAARLPQTLLARVADNAALDSVWVEYSVDGGASAALAATPVGHDSFTVALGAGLQGGQVLHYDFRARDVAGNPGGGVPLQITVRRSWLNDFENGSEGYTHGIQYYSYRDAWHLTQEDSWPAGGTSWKCGAEGPEDYLPHLDAVLVIPQIDTVEAGTVLRFDHRYDLENLDGTYAWDGARIETKVGAAEWQAVLPNAGYSHLFFSNSKPFVHDSPCWSGASGGWREETVDLSAFAPGPVKVRFRMITDDYLGFTGWFVDHVRIEYPTDVTAVAGAVQVAQAPWPNPASTMLHQRISLAAAGRVEWSLYDLAGRRVARLWRGPAGAGPLQLSARIPADLPSGLYFLRLEIDGRPRSSSRVALLQ